MGAKIPAAVAESELSLELNKHLKRVRQGKVRDTYEIPCEDGLLVVTTDRISIFDFVLNTVVHLKGVVLNLLSVFWLTEVIDVKNHLVAWGNQIDVFLPPELGGNRELWARAVVVAKLDMLPIEAVVRGYLTGSGLKSYQKDGTVCGIRLPPGLHDGSKLPEPMFTPTTKAEQGHDVHLSGAKVERDHPWLAETAIGVYFAGSQYAWRHGIILADTKFEFGGRILGDEVLTPDSSRFWLVGDYIIAQENKKSPQGWDKQPVREWGKHAKLPDGSEINISSLEPESEEDVAKVHSLEVPEQVLRATKERYLAVFEMLTDLSVDQYLDSLIK
ncbi:MAG: phosphoribosylaminoimidazolesuccinocarboxamide synthase [Acidobacteriaceae bacterium]